MKKWSSHDKDITMNSDFIRGFTKKARSYNYGSRDVLTFLYKGNLRKKANKQVVGRLDSNGVKNVILKKQRNII